MILQRRNHHWEKVLLHISGKPLKSIWLIKIWKSYLKSLGYFRKGLNSSKQAFPSGGQNFCSSPTHPDVCFFTHLWKVFNLLVALRQTQKRERLLMGPRGALQREFLSQGRRIPYPGKPRWGVGQGQLPASHGVVGEHEVCVGGEMWLLCLWKNLVDQKKSTLDWDRSNAGDEGNQSSLL